MNTDTTPSHEDLWRQYNQNVELFKFYMDLVVKLNVFYYAVTGAIISYYFTNKTEDGLEKYALLLPLVMSFAFGAFFIYGAILNDAIRKEIFRIRNALNLLVAPDVAVLSVFLIIFAVVFLMVGIGCAFILFSA